MIPISIVFFVVVSTGYHVELTPFSVKFGVAFLDFGSFSMGPLKEGVIHEFWSKVNFNGLRK